MEKKLTLSNKKKLCGVCGGFAEYVGCDPTLVRLLTAFVTLGTGLLFGVILYGAFAIIMPSKEDTVV